MTFPSVPWMQPSTSLSPTCRRYRARPSQWQRLNLDSSADITWDQCWWLQVQCLCAHMRRRRRLSRVSPGHLAGLLEQFPATTKRLWTVWVDTRRLVRLISSTPIPDDERKNVSCHGSGEDMLFSWCGHPQPMLMRPLDSSCGLPNSMEGIDYATSWHSCVPRYRPLRQHTTRQLNNEFKNSRLDIGLHDCHFVLKLQCMHKNSTQLNVFDTNATHSFLEQLEKSTLLRNELDG